MIKNEDNMQENVYSTAKQAACDKSKDAMSYM